MGNSTAIFLITLITAISVITSGIYISVKLLDVDKIAAAGLVTIIALFLVAGVLYSDIESTTDEETVKRAITIYTADGNVVAQYEGDITGISYDEGRIKFVFEDKEYFYQNCFVEMIEED